jgi:hypothetical protein
MNEDDEVLTQGPTAMRVAECSVERDGKGVKIEFAVNRPGRGFEIFNVHWSLKQALEVKAFIERIEMNADRYDENGMLREPKVGDEIHNLIREGAIPSPATNEYDDRLPSGR